MTKVIIKYEEDWYDPGYPAIGHITWKGYRIYIRKAKYSFFNWLFNPWINIMYDVKEFKWSKDDLSIEEILMGVKLIS